MHGRSCSLFERGVKWCGGAGNTRHVSVRQLRWCLPGSLCVCCFALGWLVGLSLRDLCCVLTEATRVGSAILVRVSPMFVDCCFGYSRFLLSCMGELVRVDMFVLHFSSSIFFCEKPRPVNFGRATVRDALRRYHGLWVWLDRHTWLVRIRSGRIGDTVRGVRGSRGLVWARLPMVGTPRRYHPSGSECLVAGWPQHICGAVALFGRMVCGRQMSCIWV